MLNKSKRCVFPRRTTESQKYEYVCSAKQCDAYSICIYFTTGCCWLFCYCSLTSNQLKATAFNSRANVCYYQSINASPYFQVRLSIIMGHSGEQVCDINNSRRLQTKGKDRIPSDIGWSWFSRDKSISPIGKPITWNEYWIRRNSSDIYVISLVSALSVNKKYGRFQIERMFSSIKTIKKRI